MTEIVSLEALTGRIAPGSSLAIPLENAGVSMAATAALIEAGASGLRLICVPVSGMQADLLIGAGTVMEHHMGFSPRTETLLDHAGQICEAKGARLTDLRREVLGLILDAEAPAGAYDRLDRLRATRHGARSPGWRRRRSTTSTPTPAACTSLPTRPATRST